MQHIDRKDIFYDYNYQAFLARPNLDKLLSKIYREQAKLIVVFLSEDYQRKPWPGLEFRSEEHTSELQSLMRISYAVFCLKKKIHDQTLIKYNKHIYYHR